MSHSIYDIKNNFIVKKNHNNFFTIYGKGDGYLQHVELGLVRGYIL